MPPDTWMQGDDENRKDQVRRDCRLLERNVVALQACHLALILGVDIGKDRVFALKSKSQLRFYILCVQTAYRRDLLGQIHLLLQNHLALLQWALEIHVLDLVTEIDCLLDQGDETPFDNQVDGSTLLNGIVQKTAGPDGQGLTTSEKEYKSVSGVLRSIWRFDEGPTYALGGLGSRSTWSI